MAGAGFELDWGGLDKMLGGVISKGVQTQQAMEEIGGAMVSSTVERFSTSTAPDGTAWKVAQRAEKEGGKTLVDNSVLRNSIGYEASALGVLWGTNDIRGRIHQLGGKTGRGHAVNMPARPYLGMSEEDVEEAKAIIVEHVAAMFGGSR